ncbi:hypothetical protein E2P81_ATG01098 [Venturia nashicola]|uniref:Uncharacterized protein n=1 Tax=Venturia nashicola TaxID=86259 RepID=A0A4Z1PCV4_9PEZI|nr:hypothetical protein E6O75_ATG01123 [Venturia nashicola]TLD38555.1 hypothetical protein E2P81_ATG01098 [Venturia nashicola]
MEAMWNWREHLTNPSSSGRPLDLTTAILFENASRIYQDVLAELNTNTHTSMMIQTTRLRVSIGIAIAAHAIGQPDVASRKWNEAQAFVEECAQFWSLKYVKAIILYLEADLEKTTRIVDEANKSYKGRQAYFTGLGTVWPDILYIRAYAANRKILLSDTDYHARIYVHSLWGEKELNIYSRKENCQMSTASREKMPNVHSQERN